MEFRMKNAPISIVLLLAGVVGLTDYVSAQQQIVANPANAVAQDDELVINLADKANLDLPAFVAWLSEVRSMRIVDDGNLEGKTNKVQFYGQTTVDPDTMFELVQGVLRSNGLALVRAEIEGWYKIVPLAGVRPFAPTGEPGQFGNAEYLTAVYSLTYVTPGQTEEYIRQLVYSGEQNPGNSITTLPAQGKIIISETAQKLKTILELIEQLDVPRELSVTEFYKVRYLEAQELEQQLNDLLNQTTGSSGDPSTASVERLKIRADLRTNRLIMIGRPREIENAMKLIDRLDVKLGLELQRYQFEHMSGERIDDLIKQSLVGLDEAAAARVYQSSFNEQTNQLVVTARPEIHQRIRKFIDELDVQVQGSQGRSPVRFYTLKNVKAIDILDTLQSIVGRLGEDRFGGARRRSQDRINGRNDGILSNNTGFGAGNFSQGSGTTSGFQQQPFSNQGLPFGRDDFQGGTGSTQQPGADGILETVPFPGVDSLQTARGTTENLVPGEARVTIDETSNTLIVVADPSVQQLYADLIEKLDQRRPQVLIEVSVVTISAADDFSFGIEISGGDREGAERLFSFTQFGLSQIDAATGALSIIPGRGFNGTLIDPEVADIVLRTLAAHRRSRVISAPRILVNDNATGLLSSVAEVPFSSTNSNNTVSTTSLGGFAQAGTTISVTPQISDDDFLNLEFDVLVNNFTGPGGDLPPPRNTDQVTSEVSIPDGHTVIVGGLTRRRNAQDLNGVPVLEDIPIINRLTSRDVQASEDQRLFVFIKPIILRDDKFRDLRFLSELERRDACMPDDLPESGPVLLR